MKTVTGRRVRVEAQAESGHSRLSRLAILFKETCSKSPDVAELFPTNAIREIDYLDPENENDRPAAGVALKRALLCRTNGVVLVVHLSASPKEVSDCSTSSYGFMRLVRNEEAGGSNPLSSTKIQNLHRFSEL
jgi:hypothetical protein